MLHKSLKTACSFEKPVSCINMKPLHLADLCNALHLHVCAKWGMLNTDLTHTIHANWKVTAQSALTLAQETKGGSIFCIHCFDTGWVTGRKDTQPVKSCSKSSYLQELAQTGITADTNAGYTKTESHSDSKVSRCSMLVWLYSKINKKPLHLQ